MSIAAVVLDVDGTLVDTNYLHVVAWWESFLEAGEVITCTDIHRAIGRGSDDLVHQLIGRTDEAIVAGHARRWGAVRPRMQPFAKARELVRTCAERGLRVVWATSGSDEDLEDFRRVLDVDDAVHAVVSSSDVDRSKPHPDVVEAALEAAGVTAQRAVMVGDTVFDVRAARAAGIPCLSVLAGGIGECELRAEGPTAVYADLAALLGDLDHGPIGDLLRASPR